MSDNGNLILTRRVGETICVGDDIQFTILGVKGNHVRCRVTAPKSLKVHREEIYERIRQEREQEAAVAAAPEGSTS